MSDETNNELLSAYLDGELSADERLRVEQLLAESAECRQVYEELRALRASLAALPRHKLADDLAERVLRIAEQSKLDKERSADSAGREISAAERHSRRWRAILYPLLAVAAAVAMMLNSAKEKDKHGREIARAPRSEAQQAEMSAPTADGIASDTYDAPAQRPASSAGASSARDNEDSDSMGDGPANAAPNNLFFESVPSGASGPAPFQGGMGGGMGSARRSQGDASEQKRKDGSASAVLSSDSPPPGVLVVNCKLASTAIEHKAFEALMARNHLVPMATPALALPAAPAANKPVEFEANFANRLDRSNSPPSGAVDKSEKMDEAKPAAGGKTAWSENVVVELDARQLGAVLADLRSHPDQFVSVELPTKRAEVKYQALSPQPEALPAQKDTLAAPPQARLKTRIGKPEPSEAAADSAVEGTEAAEDADSSAISSDVNSTEEFNRDAPARVRVIFRLSAAEK